MYNTGDGFASSPSLNIQSLGWTPPLPAAHWASEPNYRDQRNNCVWVVSRFQVTCMTRVNFIVPLLQVNKKMICNHNGLLWNQRMPHIKLDGLMIIWKSFPMTLCSIFHWNLNSKSLSLLSNSIKYTLHLFMNSDFYPWTGTILGHELKINYHWLGNIYLVIQW